MPDKPEHSGVEIQINPNPDLTKWYSMDDLVRILQKAPRTINEKIQRGTWNIEKRERPVPERKPEPCFNPEHVDALAARLHPKPHVIPDSLLTVERGNAMPEDRSSMGTSMAPPIMPAVFMERALSLLERYAPSPKGLPAPAPARGPWLTVKAAAARSGLSKSIIRIVCHYLQYEGSRDVINDGGWKIRESALDELDGVKLRSIVEAHRAAGPADRRKGSAPSRGSGGEASRRRGRRVDGPPPDDDDPETRKTGEEEEGDGRLSVIALSA